MARQSSRTTRRVQSLQHLARPSPGHITRKIGAHARVDFEDSHATLLCQFVVEITEAAVSREKGIHDSKMLRRDIDLRLADLPHMRPDVLLGAVFVPYADVLKDAAVQHEHPH